MASDQSRFRIPPPSVVDAAYKDKAQPYLDAYPLWVLDHLIGAKGRSRGEVAATLIREWIIEHEEWLEQRGIGFEVLSGRMTLDHSKTEPESPDVEEGVS